MVDFFLPDDSRIIVSTSCKGCGIIASESQFSHLHGPPSVELAEQNMNCWLEEYDEYDFEAQLKRAKETIKRLKLDEIANDRLNP